MHEQPEDETHRVGSVRVLSARGSVPLTLGPAGVLTNPEGPQTLYWWDFYGGFIT